jgi:hypothetical protein
VVLQVALGFGAVPEVKDVALLYAIGNPPAIYLVDDYQSLRVVWRGVDSQCFVTNTKRLPVIRKLLNPAGNIDPDVVRQSVIG